MTAPMTVFPEGHAGTSRTELAVEGKEVDKTDPGHASKLDGMISHLRDERTFSR